jgi:hypothetical protein
LYKFGDLLDYYRDIVYVVKAVWVNLFSEEIYFFLGKKTSPPPAPIIDLIYNGEGEPERLLFLRLTTDTSPQKVKDVI